MLCEFAFGSSILFLVFSPVFFGRHHSLHYSTKNRGVLMQTSFCGRLPEEECVGKEILDPLAVFFVIEYSMRSVLSCPSGQQYQVNNQIFSTTNRGSKPVNPKNISENSPSHEGGQMGCYCYILTFTPLSHNGWEELSNTTTSTLNESFCFNSK